MKDIYLRGTSSKALHHVWYKSEDEQSWIDGRVTVFKGDDISSSHPFDLLNKTYFEIISREDFLKEIKPKPKAGDWVVADDGTVGKVLDTDGITCRLMVAGEPSKLYYCKLSKLIVISEEEIIPLILKGMKNYEDSIK